MDAALFPVPSDDAPHVAGALRRPAVRSQSGDSARGFDAGTARIYRRSMVFDPGDGGFPEQLYSFLLPGSPSLAA